MFSSFKSLKELKLKNKLYFHKFEKILFMSVAKILVLNSKQIEQKINRIAHEIYEKNFEEKEMIIAGIAPNGYLLAEKITKVLKAICPIKIKLVKIIINKENPIEEKIQFDLRENEFKNKVVVIIDDVLNSGKTLIYGAKHFLKTPVKRLLT